MSSIIGHLGAGPDHSQGATVGRLPERLADGAVRDAGALAERLVVLVAAREPGCEAAAVIRERGDEGDADDLTQRV